MDGSGPSSIAIVRCAGARRFVRTVVEDGAHAWKLPRRSGPRNSQGRMKALIVVVAFVICAAGFARADQLKQTPEDRSCEVMPMDVIDNYLFFSRINPNSDPFPGKDSYMVVYLDFLRGLGVYCEMKDCSDAEPPPGGVRFGVLNDSDFEKWKCSDTIPSKGLAKEHSCGNAKFHDCSSCGTLVVSNYSGVSIDAELESDPPGIFQSGGGTEAENYYCNGKPRSCRDPDWRWSWGAAGSCESMAPEGGRCYQTIAFCPEQSGVTRGHLKVTISQPSPCRRTVKVALGKHADAGVRFGRNCLISSSA